MYSGQLIDELIDNVQQVEQGNMVRVTVARRPANMPLSNTFIYEFGRKEVFEVA